MKFIPLSELSQKQKSWILKFLLKYEHLNVQLSTLAKCSYKNIYAIFINEISNKDIYGLISTGISFLQLLPFVTENQDSALQQDLLYSLTDFLKSLKKTDDLKCAGINGTAPGTNLVIKAFKNIEMIPKQTNEYFLMHLNQKEFSSLKPYKFKGPEQIIRCNPDLPENYWKSLLSLQEEYEIAEVLPEFHSFNKENCELKMKNFIKKQYILALDNGEGELVSKVQTNAIGFKYVQLGGIYTKPSYRHKHYSYNLLYTLIKKIVRFKKNIILFVRKENLPACFLYEKLFFKKISDYKIAYF